MVHMPCLEIWECYYYNYLSPPFARIFDLMSIINIFCSYGSDWGVHGYLYLMRNENMCGVAMDAAYPIV